MSLILDALNRSRQDSDAVPGLATQHYVDAENGGGSSKSRQILPWLALGAALVVIIALLFERDPQLVPVEVSLPVPAAPSGARAAVVAASATQAQHAASVAVDPKPALAKSTPETAVAEPPAQVQAASSAVITTADAVVATVPEKTAVQRLYEQREQQATARPEQTRAAASKSALADNTAALAESADIAPAEKAPAQRKQEPIDIEKAVLQAREDLKDERLDEHPAPFIAELSQQAKNDIPTIYYQRHDYSGDSARSSVMLNSKSVKVGGNVAPGVKLDEILPDSVVLDYRGTQFRLRALNSWINL
jgi:hypothetical protein